jgi:hypothetical protein
MVSVVVQDLEIVRWDQSAISFWPTGRATTRVRHDRKLTPLRGVVDRRV